MSTVLVAGGTGAVGRPLVRRLTAAGHDVRVLSRSDRSAQIAREDGGEPVAGDLLDRDGLFEAARAAAPEVVVHTATAIPDEFDPKKVGEAFAATNRLRTEGMEHLAEAARDVGARRVIAASIAFAYAGGEHPDATEDEPLDLDAGGDWGEIVSAVAALERRTLELDGVVLRLGAFYGPGTTLAPDGSMTRLLKRRRLPIIGGGHGRWSFIHVDDAAAAVVAAVDGPPGIYNVVDDHPAPAHEWIPAVAEKAGAPAPWRVPAFVGRLAAGEFVVESMVRRRGAANDAAREQLGWTPERPDWRDADWD